jgi:hypothetical protein
MNDKIRDLKQQVSSAAAEEAETIRKEISALKQERNHEYRKMKIEEKRTLSQVRREERQADEELKRRLEKEAGEQS